MIGIGCLSLCCPEITNVAKYLDKKNHSTLYRINFVDVVYVYDKRQFRIGHHVPYNDSSVSMHGHAYTYAWLSKCRGREC